MLAVAFLAPVVFIGLTSLMTTDQALSAQLWPSPFAWHNYVEVFSSAPIWRWALNSFIYSSLATLGLLVSSIPVAYAFSRLRWRGRDWVFLVVLVALMLPPQVTVVPLYVMWAKLHLVGTLWPLIIPNWFGDAFAIFLLRQFFLTIPEEYLDAARVDGCGEFRILTSVVLRLAKPAIAAVALFSILYTWNDFFLPLLYVGENPDHWVASIGLAQFRNLHQVQWNLTMAATLLVMLPVVIVFFLAQKAFVEGVTLTGREGMKVAVIGGGSTYTPELVSGLSRRARAHRRDGARAPRRRRGAARTSSAGWRGGCSSARASAARSRSPAISTAAVEGADFVLLQIRVGGQAARLSDETVPLALRVRRPGDDGRRRLRQGAAHGAGRARDRRPRTRAGRAGRMDRRLHEPRRDRHAGAARPGAPRDRALQRRDRAAALGREAARGRARRACSSTRSGSTTSHGCGRSASTARTCCRGSSRSAARRSPRTSACARRS